MVRIFFKESHDFNSDRKVFLPTPMIFNNANPEIPKSVKIVVIESPRWD